MKAKKYSIIFFGVILAYLVTSCEDFLEVDSPDFKITSERVFQSDQTALSAMTGIYNQLFRSAYSSGWEESVSLLAGISGGEIQCIRDIDLPFLEFEHNEILPSNSRNLNLWSSAYKIIYLNNSLLEGLDEPGGLSDSVQRALEGEAKFLRAFTYFYLVNLYGKVPLLLSTDYRKNSLAMRTDVPQVYHQIISDLEDAVDLLGEEYRNGDRIHVNKSAALGLLARVHLYLENWEEAEKLSASVIDHTSLYKLEENLNEVFLANSKEALWQISPIGDGGITANTKEGAMFLFPATSHSLNKFSLYQEFALNFDPTDKRRINWIGYHEPSESYFPHKYKIRSSTEEITEYSMVLRLSEQYLIRAEARVRQNNLIGAMEDLNVIRQRAGLDLLTDPPLDPDKFLQLILEERNRELFTEWGHRWLDLKRLDMVEAILGIQNTMFPIPEEELLKNPNLVQNPGY